MELERPPAAAGALYPIIKKAGLDPQIKDFNLYLFNNLTATDFQYFEDYWRGKSDDIDAQHRQLLNLHLEKFINNILDIEPEWIGVSIFSRFSVLPAKEFLTALQTKNFQGKVVIGGQGIRSEIKQLGENEIGLDRHRSFAEYAKKNNLCNYFIQGDAEESLFELLSGNTNYPGINGNSEPKQIQNLDALPLNDYSGILPTDYYPSHLPGIYVTASRGCIRKCSFCDVPDLWPKFKMRSPDHVVNEIQKNADAGAKVFQFTDSLINGDLKKWREINKKLASLRQQDKYKDITYLGQFICRPKKIQTEEDWYWFAKGGASTLVVGFESYSQHVRNSMGKNYTNEDIDFHFEQSAKYGIKNICLMFVGYPNETLEDHQMNLEFLRKYKKYADAGIINMVRWGYTGQFDSTQKIRDNEIDLELDHSYFDKFDRIPLALREIAQGFFWKNKKNPDADLNERIRRRIELHKLSVQLGWPQTRSQEELKMLTAILKHANADNLSGESDHGISALNELKDLHD